MRKNDYKALQNYVKFYGISRINEKALQESPL